MSDRRQAGPDAVDAAGAWRLLLAVRARCRAADAPTGAFSVVDAQPTGQEEGGRTLRTTLDLTADGGWHCDRAVSPEAAELLELHLPLAGGSPARPITVGHLGQSLDGRIATEAGHSHYITGRENILHMHRLRALCDAVIVGAGTIRADNPRLTARLVDGVSPARVVIDPHLRLTADRRVFHDDLAPTRIVCRADALARCGGGYATTDLLAVACEEDQLPPAAIIDRLRSEGLFSLFVEGGGVTVSRFLAAGCLDRLQVAIAPLILGSGRPAFSLPPIAHLDEALRLDYRCYRMGGDLLLDCDLRSG